MTRGRRGPLRALQLLQLCLPGAASGRPAAPAPCSGAPALPAPRPAQVHLPSGDIKGHTDEKPFMKKDSRITFGRYDSVKPFTVKELRLHYANMKAFKQVGAARGRAGRLAGRAGAGCLGPVRFEAAGSCSALASQLLHQAHGALGVPLDHAPPHPTHTHRHAQTRRR
jgi:hypothetical protein